MINRLRTTLLLSLLTVLMVLTGSAIGSQAGMAAAFLVALAIVNPLSGGSPVSLFSTRTPLEERIARREALARGGF